ncbi:hypothetical protein J8F10_14425 [Gemmata sp. G18]|uniref:Capsid protein n=1 Tax=Gemmata palustris TaxID=2822762 RepID=A0ABS5BUB8_9BACT|nr:hypothetical protein [Gemmata palustris]MBP3956473.1 hypothetical protein [Gemmata palustris]
MALNLLELTDNGGGGMVTAITQEEGGAEVPYRYPPAASDTPPTVAAISSVFDYFTGGVNNLEPKVVGSGTNNAGKIDRTLPPVHPFRPELSAAGVTGMVGVGQQFPGTSVQVFGLPPVTDQFPLYAQYDYKVRFAKRPYFLLPNEKINVTNGTYFKPDGTSVSYLYADEWRRFTSTTRVPSNDFANATTGMMTFRTDTAADPDSFPYPNTVFMSLQNSVIEITWYQVPYRYLLDFGTQRSYLTRFVSTVNQSDWNGYAAGSLLYLGATPTSYLPASPKIQKLLNALAVGLDQNLLCNVKLRFLHTARVGTDVPQSSHALLTNKNNVAAGHNCLPNFADRKFYYAVGEGATEPVKKATFESFPFQLFFTDPMLSQPAGPI